MAINSPLPLRRRWFGDAQRAAAAAALPAVLAAVGRRTGFERQIGAAEHFLVDLKVALGANVRIDDNQRLDVRDARHNALADEAIHTIMCRGNETRQENIR